MKGIKKFECLPWFILKENTEEDRIKIQNAGISICCCTEFEDAIWLDCRPMDKMLQDEHHYLVHGMGYDEDNEFGYKGNPKGMVAFDLDNAAKHGQTPIYCDNVDEFIHYIKVFTKYFHYIQDNYDKISDIVENIITKYGYSKYDITHYDCIIYNASKIIDLVNYCYDSTCELHHFDRIHGKKGHQNMTTDDIYTMFNDELDIYIPKETYRKNIKMHINFKSKSNIVSSLNIENETITIINSNSINSININQKIKN